MSNKSINIYGNRHPKRGALVANPIPPENVFWYDIFQPIVDAINKLYTGASKPYKSGDGIYLKADGTINLTRELFSTINGNSILQGAKDIKIEAELPNFKTINGESIIGEGDIQIELPEGILTQGDNNLTQNVKFISVKSQDEETDQFGDLFIKKDFSEIEQYIYKDGYSKNFIGKDNVYFIKDSNEISGANTPSDGTIYKQGKKDIELGSTNGKMKLYSYSSFSIESLNNKISLASKGIQITSSGEVKLDASSKKVQIYDKNLAIESSTNVTINTPDFLIRDGNSSDVFRAKNDIVYVKRRFEIEENSRGNTLKLKSDGFEVMTQSSNSAQAILKMAAGGNPFDIRTTDDGGNNVRSEIFIKKPTNASQADYYPIYIRGIGGYNGDIGTTLGAKSLQEILQGNLGLFNTYNGIFKTEYGYIDFSEPEYGTAYQAQIFDDDYTGFNINFVKQDEGSSFISINDYENVDDTNFLWDIGHFFGLSLGFGGITDGDYSNCIRNKEMRAVIFRNYGESFNLYWDSDENKFRQGTATNAAGLFYFYNSNLRNFETVNKYALFVNEEIDISSTYINSPFENSAGKYSNHQLQISHNAGLELHFNEYDTQLNNYDTTEIFEINRSTCIINLHNYIQLTIGSTTLTLDETKLQRLAALLA